MAGEGAPVLVTGGCGFIGARLVARLVAGGAAAVIVDDLSRGTAANLPPAIVAAVPIVAADVRDAAAMRACMERYRPRAVYHLAAIHFIPACEADRPTCIAVNVAGTQAVLDACAAAGSVETVVVASSAAVYAPSEAAHDEESALGPVDMYGHTKLWCEQLAALFHRRTGIGVGIARQFNVFGPGETNPHLIPRIIQQALAGPELHLGDLSRKRDYVYVDDVARAYVALADHCRAGGILTCNIGSERQYDGWEVVRTIERLLGRPLAVVQDPALLRRADPPALLSDCRRAHDLLGWYAETTLEAGIAAALRHPLAAGSTRDA